MIPKQGKFQTTMFLIGFILAALPLIYLMRNLITSMSPMLMAILGIGLLSFAGWFYLEMAN
jgi:multisubunit Na+/H+ antiporter MnhE subunit